MFVFCMYVRLLFDIDTFADDGDSGLMKYSNLVVNTLQYFLVKSQIDSISLTLRKHALRRRTCGKTRPNNAKCAEILSFMHQISS